MAAAYRRAATLPPGSFAANRFRCVADATVGELCLRPEKDVVS